MLAPSYPLQPEPIDRSWIERHPLWKIPLGCLTLLVLMAGFAVVLVTVITGSFRQSDVYKRALTMAKENAQVREQMGEPIEAKWFVSGEIHINGSMGNADISIPISGPRGSGAIRAIAYKKGGVWTFTWLQVKVSGHPDSIDLLSIQPNPGT